MRKVLFIDSAHPVLAEEMKKLDFTCDFFEGTNREKIEEVIGEYEGVIVRSKVVFDKNLIDKARKLKFIGRVGAGMESIDSEYAWQKGIACLNSPEGNRDAVGEHAIGLLLSLLNHLNRADSQVRNGLWKREENRGIEIKGKTISIIGYGNMGSSFAQKISGFEAKVLAFDKYKTGFTNQFVTEVDMNTLFGEADILSLHVPLTSETHYMMDDAYINRFKKNIILINTSRGKVVKTEDLVKNLQSGKVIAAGLDVLEYEPHSFDSLDMNTLPEAFYYLQKADNVLLTPHIAGWTVESKYKLAKVLAEKIKALYTTT